jgi:hypothetical protein
MVLPYSLRPHHGFFTNISLMGHWYFHTYLNVLQSKHKQPNFHK